MAISCASLKNGEAQNAAMKDTNAEIEARYHVVTLLYHGKINEAEQALDGFVNDGTISKENEAFYRFLLNGAHQFADDLDASFHDIPTDVPTGQPVASDGLRS
jgi:hypothetical protein